MGDNPDKLNRFVYHFFVTNRSFGRFAKQRVERFLNVPRNAFKQIVHVSDGFGSYFSVMRLQVFLSDSCIALKNEHVVRICFMLSGTKIQTKN